MTRRLLALGFALSITLPAAAAPTKDRNDDPLPTGAVARLGSLTFCPAHSPLVGLCVAVAPGGKTMAVGETLGVRLFDIESGRQTGFVKLSAPGGIKAIAFAPDGKRLAATIDNLFPISRPPYDDMSIVVADVARGNVLWQTKEELNLHFGYSQPGFAAGGQVLLTGRADGPNGSGAIVAFDAGTGATKWSLTDVRSFAVVPGGGTLACGREDGHVVLLDAATGKEKSKWKVLDGPVTALAWSADAKLLASGGGFRRMEQPDAPPSGDHRVRVWDVKTEKALFTTKVDGDAESIVFSPDGGLLEVRAGSRTGLGDFRLLGDNAGNATRLWDVAAGRDLWNGAKPDKQPKETSLSDGMKIAMRRVAGLLRVSATKDGTERWHWWAAIPPGAVLSPDGKHLVTAVPSLSVIDLATGRDRAVGVGHRLPVYDLSISPDGAFAISSDEKHNYRVWKLADGSLIPGADGPLAGVRSVDGGKRVVSISFDGNVRLWRPGDGKTIKAFTIKECFHPAVWKEGYVNENPTFGFTADGQVLAVQTVKAVEVWDVAKGERVARHDGFPDAVTKLVFSPDGRFLTAGAKDRDLRLFEVTGKELKRWPPEKVHSDAEPAFSPDSRWLAWAVAGKLRLWDVTAGAAGPELPGFIPFAFAGDCSMLAAHAADQSIRLWQIPDGKEMRTISGDRWKQSVVYFHAVGGTIIAEVSLDPKHSEWSLVDVGAGRTIVPRMGSFARRAFSPDGRVVAVGDREISLYEMATGRPIGKLPEGHRGDVTALAFAPDGRTLLTGGSEGTILVWDWAAACGLKPSAQREPAELWQDLLGNDAKEAYRAILTLRASPKTSVAWLRDHLKPAGEENARRIRRLVAALDADNFRARDAAAKELRRLGVEAEPFLREALTGKLSAESDKRVKTLFGDPEIGRLHPETVRAIRAVQVLDGIDSDEARSLLGELARGDARMLITREARRTARPQSGRP